MIRLVKMENNQVVLWVLKMARADDSRKQSKQSQLLRRNELESSSLYFEI
jgi:hypothetical protein